MILSSSSPNCSITTFYDCLNMIFDDQTEPQLVPKLLIQVSVKELYNSLVIDPNDGDLKPTRDKDDNIISSYDTLRSLLPPQI